MSHAQFKLDIFKSEAKSFVITLVDAKTGAGIDLTGATLLASFAIDLDIAAIFTKTTPASGIVIDPDQATNPGKFTLTIDVADTSGLAVAEHVWDLWRDDEVVIGPSVFDVQDSVRFT